MDGVRGWHEPHPKVQELRADYGAYQMMLDLRKLSFGGPGAIVTSMALIVGLDISTAAKTTVVTSLLIIGIADNLTDSLSVHIYQESERMAERQALRTTVGNFLTRLTVALSFIFLFLLFPTSIAIYICVAWGFILLSALSCLIARVRHASAISEVWKHSAVALVVIALSKAIGAWLPAMMSLA
jgi:VIT1/CCC1 family predicted Fe2+/Mn2+ transporter